MHYSAVDKKVVSCVHRGSLEVEIKPAKIYYGYETHADVTREEVKHRYNYPRFLDQKFIRRIL